MRFFPPLLLLLFLAAGSLCQAQDIQRFPPPDFESGHQLPATHAPSAAANGWNVLDVLVLFAALTAASVLVHHNRSRNGIFLLSIFSLIYFGFYRQGCVCPIGATQNVTLAFFDGGYALPITVAAFFLLPLIFSLFFGRVFCAGVCPLGAIQDLVLIKPIPVAAWVRDSLSLLAYLYLGTAVYFAAMGSSFIICNYDPFIGFFRMSGTWNMIVFGACLLVIGLFVGRPYCLFLCPYSVLLKWLSRLSMWRVTVAPKQCIQCRLCEEACPFGAIEFPTPEGMPAPGAKDKSRLVFLILIAPVVIAASGWMFSLAGPAFARMHYDVRLAERITLEDAGDVQGYTDQSKAFRDSGKSLPALYQNAQAKRAGFIRGAWILGGFMGLVISLKLIGLSMFRKRVDYDADRADCLACGRCFSSCPPEAGWNYEESQSSAAP